MFDYAQACMGKKIVDNVNMSYTERFEALKTVLNPGAPALRADDGDSRLSLREISPWIDPKSNKSTDEVALVMMAIRNGQNWRSRLFLNPEGEMRVDLFVFDHTPQASRGLGYLAIPEELQDTAIEAFLTVAEQHLSHEPVSIC